MRKLTILLFFLLLCAFVLEFSLNVRMSTFAGLSFKNLAIYSLVLLMLAGNAINRRPIIASGPVTLPAVAFVSYCTISLFLTGMFEAVRGYSLGEELLYFKAAMDPYVLLIVVFSLVHDERTIKTMLHLLVLLLLVFLLITVLGSFNIVSIERVYLAEASGRTRGAFSEWNNYPLYVVTFMPLVAAQMLSARSSVRKVFFATVLMLCGYNVLLAGSRGGLVSLAAGIGVYYLVASRKSLGAKLAGAIGMYLVVLVGMVALYYLLPETSAEIFLSKISGAYFDSGKTQTDYSSGRLGLWESSWAGFLSSPIVGTGWRTFVPLFGGNSHNDYLLYLVTTGIVGLYLFVLVFVRMLKTAYRHSLSDPNNRRFYYSFLAGFAAYMTGSFLVNVYTPAYFVFIYAALVLKLGFVAKHAQVSADVSHKALVPKFERSRNAILRPRRVGGDIAGYKGPAE